MVHVHGWALLCATLLPNLGPHMLINRTQTTTNIFADGYSLHIFEADTQMDMSDSTVVVFYRQLFFSNWAESCLFFKLKAAKKLSILPNFSSFFTFLLSKIDNFVNFGPM